MTAAEDGQRLRERIEALAAEYDDGSLIGGVVAGALRSAICTCDHGPRWHVTGGCGATGCTCLRAALRDDTGDGR